MKFEEALKELKKGNKIKRVDDKHNYCLELDDFECGYELGLAELNGEWQVIEQILRFSERDILQSQIAVYKWLGYKVATVTRRKASETQSYLEFELEDSTKNLFNIVSPSFESTKFKGMLLNMAYSPKELEL